MAIAKESKPDQSEGGKLWNLCRMPFWQHNNNTPSSSSAAAAASGGFSGGPSAGGSGAGSGASSSSSLMHHPIGGGSHHYSHISNHLSTLEAPAAKRQATGGSSITTVAKSLLPASARRKLRLDPSTKMYFPYEPGKQVRSAIRMKNTSKSHVAFKFQTTAPKSCFMRPPGAILSPGESLIATVFKFVEHPENNENLLQQKCKVKFKILSLKVKGPMDYAPELFDEQKDQVVVERVLRVVFLDVDNPSPQLEKLKNQLAEADAALEARKNCDGTVRHQGSIGSMEARMVELGHVIPTHVNVLEFAMDTMSGSKIMELEENVGRKHETQISKHVNADHDRVLYANSHVGEVLILAERFFKNVLRTRQLFMARMVQSLLAGIGLGTIFINVTNIQARLGFFAFSLTFLLSSTTEGLPVYLQEKRILQRETSRGAYRVSSYVIANALIFLPFLLAGALLYTVPVYWLVGLRAEIDRFLYFSLVVWMVMLMANSFVACFSAIVPNFIMGNSVISGLMGSFFLFSGYFISKDNIPKYWIFMHYLSLFKYPFEAFVLNEYGGEKGRRECLQMEESGCVVTGGMFVEQYGLKEAERWSNIWVMLGFIVGYRLLCFVFLWFKCKKMRR